MLTTAKSLQETRPKIGHSPRVTERRALLLRWFEHVKANAAGGGLTNYGLKKLIGDGVSDATFHKFETGATQVLRQETIDTIVKALNCISPEEFQNAIFQKEAEPFLSDGPPPNDFAAQTARRTLNEIVQFRPFVAAIRVLGDHLSARGVHSGDYLLYDSDPDAVDALAPGDLVVASRVNPQSGETTYHVRFYAPPVLIADIPTGQGGVSPLLANQVQILGGVIGSLQLPELQAVG